jgi:DHA3 family multidrug efflux protein-like MFS transporter
MKNFIPVLINTAVANLTTSFLWFALTFWVYLETRSVLATGLIGGTYMLLVAISSLFFGTFVDQNRKKTVMVASGLFTLTTYAIASLVFVLTPANTLLDWTGPFLWIFAAIVLIGSVVENMRNIALSTTVTLLVPKKQYANANGLVGTVQGLGFLVTSVFSGLSIGFLGMGWTLAIALAMTFLATIHLVFFVKISEEKIAHDPELANKKIDIKGSIAAIKVVPGLFGLLIFSTFNNFIGGIYMALMDPYGLTLFSVQIWGIVLGVTSTGFIIGGIIIAKRGLGKKPLRTLLIANIIMATIGILFGIREFWLLYAVGIFMYMLLIPIIEATEQTIIQTVVPLKRQGRVFGFAQSFEAAASPITALLIGPIAQFWVIPYVNSADGQSRLGWLLGSGDARGIALLFVIGGLIMFVAAILAFKTRSYKVLSQFYSKT